MRAPASSIDRVHTAIADAANAGFPLVPSDTLTLENVGQVALEFNDQIWNAGYEERIPDEATDTIESVRVSLLEVAQEMGLIDEHGRKMKQPSVAGMQC